MTFFSFPNPVNETAVRVTATGVAVMVAAALAFQRPEILVIVAYGFLARVVAGPRISPLALLSTRVITPRIPGHHRLVPGAPKRFAQGLGAVASGGAVAAYYALGWHVVAWSLAALILLLATLEATLRICVGCIIHAQLAKRGVLATPVCEECADVRLVRVRQGASA
ncbi:MAG: hypothetical protein QOG53_842 [Frankiales bacterium]|jgi:hypothetical protein|nr:hypothetical protein [Frankiales bacterium]